MRDIKFRAFTKKNKPQITYLDIESVGDFMDKYGDKTTIFMEFTGFSDKEKKEIYEFDIVKIRNPKQNHYTVKLVERDKESGSWGIYSFHQEFMKIIGDIYSTPELLTNLKEQ